MASYNESVMLARRIGRNVETVSIRCVTQFTHINPKSHSQQAPSNRFINGVFVQEITESIL